LQAQLLSQHLAPAQQQAAATAYRQNTLQVSGVVGIGGLGYS